ncbi:MAG: NAD(P)H-binding protein [Burkholderiales bacterium]
MAPRSALIVGASGLVGAFLLERLLASPAYAQVTAWGRRELVLSHPKLTAEVVDFARLFERRVQAADVFCCVGSTIRQAGSQAAFRRVDFDIPVALARAAARDGAKRFLVISALGANARSRVFYNRVKGEMEAAVRASGVPKVYVFRPSLLAGPRKEFRLGERAGLAAASLLGPLLGKYRPVRAGAVAAAMLKAAEEDLPGGVYQPSNWGLSPISAN